jgi:hypothetical protein
MKDQEKKEGPPEAKAPEWTYKTRLPIQDRMAEVVKLTKQAAESELAVLRRKLKKMQYGS